MKLTFSQLCSRRASAHPYKPWRTICQEVSAGLRRKTTKTVVENKAVRLPYKD